MSEPERRATLLRAAIGRPGPATPTQADWAQWLWLAQTDRVAPLLYQVVERTPTDLDDDARTEIRQQQGVVMCRCVELEHHLLAVTALLSAHGITSVVLKGGATAHLDYPEPSWREFGDIDILIDPAERERATALVQHDGWTQGYPLPPWHDRYTHAVTFVSGQIELDLHQRIAHRALGLLVPTAELLERSTPFEVAGRTLRALDDVDRVIHATIHAVTSSGRTSRLSSVADVLLLADQRADLAADTLWRAERWRVRSLIELGIRDAYQQAQLPVPDRWREVMATPARRRDRLVDRAYLAPARRPVVEELAYLRLLRGWRDRFRYVGGYLAADGEEGSPRGRAGTRGRAKYLASKLRVRS